MRTCTLLVFMFLLISCEKEPTGDLPPNVVQAIQTRVDKGVNPSIVVGIINKDGPRYYSFGKTSLTGSPVNEHTIYEIGSISKVFTGILLAHQAAAGKLNVDDPAQKYLPPTVHVPKRGDKEISLGNLSDHTSGLPRMPSNFAPRDYANPYADYTVENLYEFISGYTLSRDVGAEYEYSNLAQGLLGHILALNADTSYQDLMIDVIARPLGMNETKVVLDDIMKKNLAVGHSDGEEVSNWDIPTLAGAGGIRSSAHDMLKFLAANLGLINTPLKSAMETSHIVRHLKAGEARVGLGWHIYKGKLGDVIWHNGGTGGYRTFAGFVKETQKGVVVFTNSTAGADDLGLRLLNPDAVIQPEKPTVAAALRKTLDSLGTDAAINCYKDFKQNRAGSYDFSEGVLNTLGYDYLDKNLPAAIAFFKLNMEEYPTSYRVYHSYADALRKEGNKDVAIQNYQRSLELNPANMKAIAVLENLGVTWEPSIINISAEILQAYTGTYRMRVGPDIKIIKEGDQLFAESIGMPKVRLYPKSQKEFYTKVVRATLTFDDREHTLTLYQGGQELSGRKVE